MDYFVQKQFVFRCFAHSRCDLALLPRAKMAFYTTPTFPILGQVYIAERERGRKSANYWRFFCIPNCTFSTQDRTIQGCFHLNYNYYEQTKIKQNSLFSLSFSYLITRVAAGCAFMPLNSDPDPTFHFQYQKKKKTWLDSGSRSSIFYGSGSDRTQIRIPALNLAEGYHDLYNVTYRGAYGRRTAV